MIVYIAGKINGDPNYREKFAKAESMWKRTGATVINPARLPDGLTGADYMRICSAMLEAADAIILLPDWKESGGARIEKSLAEYMGKAVLE